jgi:Ca2+-binding EF-hand superfamily protein
MPSRTRILVAALLLSCGGIAVVAVPSFADSVASSSKGDLQTVAKADLQPVAFGAPGWGGGDGPEGRPPPPPAGGPGGPMEGGPQRLIEQFDANKDGSITQQEIDTGRADQLKKFDADGNGVLSLDEYRTLWVAAMQEPIVRSFQSYDKDGDAKVTITEFSERLDSLVQRLDHNHDGKIDANELLARNDGPRDPGGPGGFHGPHGPGGFGGPGGPGGFGGPGGPDRGPPPPNGGAPGDFQHD